MRTIFVPGRVNLLGEHTDYNAGLALPFALRLGVTLCERQLDNGPSLVETQDFGTWTLGQPAALQWHRQVASALALPGAPNVHWSITSTVPAGVGLSSSAAFCGALVLARDVPGDLVTVARTVQQVEHDAGSEVGLLDPLATLGALEHHALLIDFATCEWRDVPFPESVGVTVVESGVTRSLADSRYRDRRRECDEAARHLGGWENATMREVAGLPSAILRARARHVLGESERVRAGVVALEAGDVATIGSLVTQSHVSLRDDFDVSLPVIDELVETLTSQGGVYGARLVGGGFGGCVLVVHDPDVSPVVTGQRSWRLRAASGAFELLGRPR